jgi:protein TonB
VSLASKGANLYQSEIPETEDLPPHRAAVPVHPSVIEQAAAARRGHFIGLSIVFSLVLHGGFFAAALVWGQGDSIPEAQDGGAAVIRVEVAQIHETIAEKNVPASDSTFAEFSGDGQEPDEPIIIITSPPPPELRQQHNVAAPEPEAEWPAVIEGEKTPSPAEMEPAQPAPAESGESLPAAAETEAAPPAAIQAEATPPAAETQTAQPASAESGEPLHAAAEAEAAQPAAIETEAPPPAVETQTAQPAPAESGEPLPATAEAEATPSAAIEAEATPSAAEANITPPVAAEPATPPTLAAEAEKPQPAAAEPIQEAAVAEPDADDTPAAPARADISLAETEVPGLMADNLLPTVAVEAAQQRTEPQPSRREEAAMIVETRDRSYLPPERLGAGLPEARASILEEQAPAPRSRARPKRAAEFVATASVAPDGGRDIAPRRGSRAAVLAYKRRVRERIMQNLPQNEWGAGRVVIGLRLSRAGALLSTSVVKSSGRPALDRAALNSVRNAGPYPPPPTKGGPGQLALSMDFQFE